MRMTSPIAHLPTVYFLNKSFNDDGAEASYILPTDFYSEIGGGVFRGDAFPIGGPVTVSYTTLPLPTKA